MKRLQIVLFLTGMAVLLERFLFITQELGRSDYSTWAWIGILVGGLCLFYSFKIGGTAPRAPKSQIIPQPQKRRFLYLPLVVSVLAILVAAGSITIMAISQREFQLQSFQIQNLESRFYNLEQRLKKSSSTPKTDEVPKGLRLIDRGPIGHHSPAKSQKSTWELVDEPDK